MLTSESSSAFLRVVSVSGAPVVTPLRFGPSTGGALAAFLRSVSLRIRKCPVAVSRASTPFLRPAASFWISERVSPPSVFRIFSSAVVETSSSSTGSILPSQTDRPRWSGATLSTLRIMTVFVWSFVSLDIVSVPGRRRSTAGKLYTPGP